MKFSNNLKQRLSGRHYACADAIDYVGKKVLNIGCGNGSFEFLAHIEAKEIVGIDTKYEDLLIAREECKNFKNVSFARASIVDDDLPTEACDVVTMFDVIEHLPEGYELEALYKIYGALKPSGQIIISTPLDNFTKFLDPAWYLRPRHRHYSKEQLAELLINAGFEVEGIYIRGGFYEVASMLLLYPFKWILNMEIPFKKWFDKKRFLEYMRNDGYVTLFMIARKDIPLRRAEI